MLRRRRSAPVLAVIPPRPPGPAGPGALSRRQLEAYSLLLGALGGARVVNVTGAAASSTVATGLATAAVIASRRAVLLECDLVRPSIAASLGLAEAPGLSDYLRGAAEAAEILQPLVLAGPATGSDTGYLVCVVAGGPTPDVPALLASDGLRHAIARLRSAYELVVIAGPRDHSDGSLLTVSAQADMTIACCSLAEARAGRWDGVAGIVLSG